MDENKFKKFLAVAVPDNGFCRIFFISAEHSEHAALAVAADADRDGKYSLLVLSDYEYSKFDADKFSALIISGSGVGLFNVDADNENDALSSLALEGLLEGGDKVIIFKIDDEPVFISSFVTIIAEARVLGLFMLNKSGMGEDGIIDFIGQADSKIVESTKKGDIYGGKARNHKRRAEDITAWVKLFSEGL